MKFLYLTDTHLRGVTPANRLDNFVYTLEQKLEEVVSIARENRVEAILHGGDLWDIPLPAIHTCANFVWILKQANCPIYIIPGNHDLFGQNEETLGRTMLGFMATTGIVRLLVPGEPVFFEKGGKVVQLTGQGFHFEMDRRDPRLDYCVKKPKSPKVDFAIHLVHGMLMDKPIFGDALATLIKDIAPYTEADLTLCGHIHMGFEDQTYGDPKTGDIKIFMNIGALARVSNHISEIQRTPQVLLIDVDGDPRVSRIRLKCAQPGSKVLDRTRIEAAAAREEKLNSFAHVVGEAGSFQGVNIRQVVDDVTNLNNLAEDVRNEGLRRISLAEEELAELGYLDGQAAERTYITQVEIQNFQSHGKTRLEFGPGLNVLVGPSDQGKTAVLRALRWVFFNEPKGMDFFRLGTNSCRVAVTMNNGIVVTRERERGAGGRNKYILTYPPAPGQPTPKEQVFEGFGNDIPAEVLAAHGVREVRLDLDTEANLSLARQLEGPFLMELNGASRAKAIGRLSGVHVIDAGIRGVNKDAAGLNSEQRQIQVKVMNLNEQLKEYADLPVMKARVAKVEANVARLEEMEQRGARLVELKMRLENIQGGIRAAEMCLELLDQLDTVEANGERLAVAADRFGQMQLTMWSLKGTRDSIQACQEELLNLIRVDYADVFLNELGTRAERINRLALVGDMWTSVKREMDQVSTVLNATNQVQFAEVDANSLSLDLARIVRLLELDERMKSLNEALVSQVRILQTTANVDQAEANCSELIGHVENIKSYQWYHRNHVFNMEVIERLMNNRIEPTNGLDAVEANLFNLEQLLSKKIALHNVDAKANGLKREMNGLGKRLDDIAEWIRDESQSYGVLLAEIGQCPTCAGPISAEQIQRAVAELAN